MPTRKYPAKGSQTRSNTGCIFWLAAFIVVIVLFIANWGKIQATLDRTNFTDVIKTQNKTKDTDSPVTKPTISQPDIPIDKPPLPSTLAPAIDDQKENNKEKKATTGQGDALPNNTTKPTPPNAVAPPSFVTTNPTGGIKSDSQKIRLTTLFFVKVKDEGAIIRQEVKRNLKDTGSPLLDAMTALLAGPNQEELRANLTTLIPQGTRLRSLKILDTRVYLDFNEVFMYNKYGIEGYAAQLRQVVYTATSFPTIQDVQILIEGKQRDYLGGEGVYIGKPLSRASFQ